MEKLNNHPTYTARTNKARLTQIVHPYTRMPLSKFSLSLSKVEGFFFVKKLLDIDGEPIETKIHLNLLRLTGLTPRLL